MKCQLKLITRGSRYSIAHQYLDDPKCQKHVIAAVGHQIKAEVRAPCANNTNSVQRKKDAKCLKTFAWGPIVNEKHAPTLVELLRFFTQTGKKRNLQGNHQPEYGLVPKSCISSSLHVLYIQERRCMSTLTYP